MKSVDGHEVNVDDTIWVWSAEHKEYNQHTVAEVYESKVMYTETCQKTGYFGARYNLVYKNKPNEN